METAFQATPMLDETNVLSDLDQLQSRYDDLHPLGHDGSCIVYGGRIRGTDRGVAVKVLTEAEPRANRPGTLCGWQAHTMQQLAHPNLVPLHAVHHLQGGAVALAMEHRRRPTLAAVINRLGPLPVAQVELVLRDIAAALGYVHERGVVHRGVRPQSIFLDEANGRVLLAHFGIDHTREGVGETARHTANLRTIAYFAPEQLDGQARIDEQKLTSQSDLYSLGLVGHVMLTGEQPRESADPDPPAGKPLRKAGSRVAELREDAPDYLCRAIEGCLEKRPRRRWRTAEEFLEQLDAAGGGSPPEEKAGLAILRSGVKSSVGAFGKVLGERLPDATRTRLAVAVPSIAFALVTFEMLQGDHEMPVISIPPSEVTRVEIDPIAPPPGEPMATPVDEPLADPVAVPESAFGSASKDNYVLPLDVDPSAEPTVEPAPEPSAPSTPPPRTAGRPRPRRALQPTRTAERPTTTPTAPPARRVLLLGEDIEREPTTLLGSVILRD
ncbi:MAG: protein kinase [Gemmatimonas sp.]|nr:protein kinase [Gemmatimonas sp.]